MIEAVLFDLDDTLYDQRGWLAGAWVAVAAAAAPFGVDADPLWRALLETAAEGTDGGGIIDRALERVGATGVPVGPFLEAFRSHDPLRLATYPGVTEALERLRDRCRIGLVTDGDPRIQRSKLRALGLLDAFDVVVFSVELGRERQAPSGAVPGRARQPGRNGTDLNPGGTGRAGSPAPSGPGSQGGRGPSVQLLSGLSGIRATVSMP